MDNSDDIQRGHFNVVPQTASADPFQMTRRDHIEGAPSSAFQHYQPVGHTATTGPASISANDQLTQLHHHHHQQAHLQINNLPQPVSGSPSSISIITPLIGPPTQQQQQQPQQHTTTVSASIGTKDGGQQQSMMKPIFVVGNPISERDYSSIGASNSLFYHQYPKETPVSGYQLPQSTVGDMNSMSPLQQQPANVGKSAKGVDAIQHQVAQQEQTQQHEPQLMQQKPAQPKAADHSVEYHTQQMLATHPSRPEKSAEPSDINVADNELALANSAAGNSSLSANVFGGDRMSGPPLVYSDGRLSSVQVSTTSEPVSGGQQTNASLAPPSPRLLQSGAAVLGNNLRRPSLPPAVNQANAASGFRSPLSPSGPLLAGQPAPGNGNGNGIGMSMGNGNGNNPLQPPVNSMSSGPNFYQSSPPYAGATLMSGSGGSIFNSGLSPTLGYNKPQNGYMLSQANQITAGSISQQALQQQQTIPPQMILAQNGGSSSSAGSSVATTTGGGYSSRRPLNITRVERK